MQRLRARFKKHPYLADSRCNGQKQPGRCGFLKRALTLIAQLTLMAGVLSLIGCPGPAPQLDPKYLTGGTGGTTTTGSGGEAGCTSAKPVPAVCARAADGVHCALSDGVSALGASSLWAPALSDALDWTSPEYYETIAYPDVDGDGLADVCARAVSGIYCGLDTGTEFAQP